MKKGVVGLAIISQELDTVLEIAPFLNKLMPGEIGVTVTNTEEVLDYYPADNLMLKNADGDVTKAGDSVGDNWAISKAMDSKQLLITEIDSSVAGTPYIAISNPIISEKGEVIGGITISQATDKKEKLLDIAQKLSEANETVSEQVENISIESDKTVKTGDRLESIAHETESKVTDMEEIVGIIENIASTIKMIGINASIEAARAGKHGRGFSVVAQEIQDLADRSSDSTGEVTEMIQQVYTIVERLSSVINELNEINRRQAESIEKIYSRIQNLTVLGNEVLKMGRDLK